MTEPQNLPLQPYETEKSVAIPDLCVVALVGASGSGKSTFAARHFKPTEILSSDTCRAMVCDDELDQSATADAFEVLHFVAAKRLARGKLVVVDATNVQSDARRAVIALAKSQHVFAVAIVFDVPERVCLKRNAERTDRQVPDGVIRRQCRDLREMLRSRARDGFRQTYVIGEADAANVRIERTRLWTDRRDDRGPFDIIGDVHGCAAELRALLGRLGYARDAEGIYRHPDARHAFFVGDLADRGPNVVDVLDIVRAMVEAGTASAVPGNHDEKLLRWLRGRNVTPSHGLQDSIDQIERLPAETSQEWRATTAKFLDGLVSHAVLDGGRIVVAHAGLIERMHGRSSGAVREFCLYGDTTGEIDRDGLPVRRDWAAQYRGTAAVVYGHTPVDQARWVNNTINIDTGCVFGGKLTALRWPERELVAVEAFRRYAEPTRSFLSPTESPALPVGASDLLLSDVISPDPSGGAPATDASTTAALGGRTRRIQTELAGSVAIDHENAAAALEVMSRYAVDPRWLVYLPPTMSPCGTESNGPMLEHPRSAFEYFRSAGVAEAICQEKHMGSRAVLVICRDGEAAKRRFGMPNDTFVGECYTRTGRRFFEEPVQSQLLDRVRAALSKIGFWDVHGTDWAVIDAEIVPWNAKAQALLREQYAPVAGAASASLSELARVAALASARGIAIPGTEALDERRSAVDGFRDAYRRYCWAIDGLSGVCIAPFHLLATEGKAHTDKTNRWHLESLRSLSDADPALFRATDHISVILGDEASERAAADWWFAKTESGAEGMVVKPLDFAPRSSRGPIQPAVKCRGREYLRIIYGPEYTLSPNLDRLRSRGLGRKRGLATKEFALGIEALNRFVGEEPLHRVHECVFAVLALESEPVDPRL